MLKYTIIAATIFLGSTVAGTAGFGLGVVAMSILPLVMSVKIANPMLSLYAVIMFTIMSLRLRNSMDWRKSTPLVIGAALGMPLGVLGLVYLDETLMRRIIGGFIIVYVVYDLVFGNKIPKGIDLRWGYLAGFLGGCTGGAFNVGGPPAVIYCNAQPWDKNDVKAAIQFYLLFSHFYKVVILLFSGLLTKTVLLYDLYFSPFLLTGIFAGELIFSRLKKELFHRVILALLSVSGLILIFKSA